MPIKAANVVPARNEAIKRRVNEGKNQPPKEWRVDGHPGLVLITRPTGSGTFYLFYRPEHGNKQRKLRIGDYPTISLADASRTAQELRLQVEKGADPAVERSNLRASPSFQAMAEAFLASPSISAATKQTYGWTLKSDVYPAFGSIPATAVTPDHIVNVCRKIRARGSLVQAQRTKATIGGVFSWGMENSFVKTNPARSVPNQLSVPSIRTRTPSTDELAALWLAIDKPSRMTLATKIIVKLAILSGQRRKEVCGAKVDELSGLDTDTPLWTIAASVTKAGRVISEGRMKNKSEQRVYLSRQAAALFRLAVGECSNGIYLFPADTSRANDRRTTRTPHIHGESITRAMARLCEAAKVDDVTVHDMRRAIGNFLKDAGIGREVRDLILHHKDDSVDGVHYSSSARMEQQCRDAWQLWADHVEKIVSKSANENQLASL